MVWTPFLAHSEVFTIRDADGQPYVLIGGQAVNDWAEHYLSTEPRVEMNGFGVGSLNSDIGAHGNG